MQDPYDRIHPPVNLADLEEDPEPRMSLDEVFSEYLHLETLGSGLDAVEFPLHTDVCRFDEAGNHTLMAQRCPHFDGSDELGRTIRPGWTAQNAG